jgi:SAM-dependent methyltransferase
VTRILQTEPYTALSSVYQAAGFAAYSQEIAPKLLAQAFELEWTGRTLVDLACGSGDLACWFGEHGFRVTGVDLSASMLRFGTERSRQIGIDVQFLTSDIRTYKPDRQVELATCIGGSLNYMPTLRDLESVFRQAQAAVQPGKLFIFDLRTIKGLADTVSEPQIVFNNNNDILIVAENTFSYETLLLNTRYIIWRFTSAGWQRAEEVHALRGYPVQAVMSLLAKTGFRLRRTLTPELQPADTNHQEAQRLVFVAEREG